MNEFDFYTSADFVPFYDGHVLKVGASGSSKRKSKTAAAEKMLTFLKARDVVDADEISR